MSKMLKVGERVLFRGKTWTVEFVNQCRARIRPEGKGRRVIIRDDEGEIKAEFEGSNRSINIAPESDLPRLPPKEQEDEAG